MSDENKAVLKIHLKAENGYQSKEVHNITLSQWRDLQLVLAGKISSEFNLSPLFPKS